VITLVTGGSGSGKSEYGEALVVSFNRPLNYYVATMEVLGKESMEKVKRHREQRKGKGFITLECKRNLGILTLDDAGQGNVCSDSQIYGLQSDAVSPSGLAFRGSSDSKAGKAVLLECISNLAANEMFSGESWKSCGGLEALASRIVRDIASLSSQAEDMVIVTNEVGSGGGVYETETMEYIRLMGLINQQLADMADRVVEVVYGIPVVWNAPDGSGTACLKGAEEL